MQLHSGFASSLRIAQVQDSYAASALEYVLCLHVHQSLSNKRITYNQSIEFTVWGREPDVTHPTS